MRDINTVMADSIVESLHQGIFQDKYKVFCRGITTGTTAIKKQNFRTEYTNNNSYFLLCDVADDHLALSKYLNTGILAKSADIIFETIMVVAPNNIKEDTANKCIPKYFTVKDDGEIVCLSADDMKTLLGL